MDGQTQTDKDCHVCQSNSSRTNWTLKKGSLSLIYIYQIHIISALYQADEKLCEK